MDIVSTANIELDKQLDDIMDYFGTGSNTHDMLEEQFRNSQYESLEEHNPIQKVYVESKQHILRGTGINLYSLYAPKIVPHLIKIMKFLPLGLGTMKQNVPIVSWHSENKT